MRRKLRTAPTKGTLAVSKITTEIVTITPARAEQWLDRNVANRRLKQSAVEKLAEAIQRGEWRLNGAAIVFDTDGVLRDGQHRLAAIARSGVTVDSVVAWGVDPAAQTTIDVGGGGRRTLADTLTMRGETNATILAGALTHLFRLQQGHPRNLALRPTIDQALAILDANPNLRESASIGRGVNAHLRANPSLMAFLHYHLSCIDDADAKDFFERLTTGEDLRSGNPIYALRDVLIKDATSIKRLPIVFVYAYTIKAWNAYRLGESLKLLRWRAGGAKPEAFPEAI